MISTGKSADLLKDVEEYLSSGPFKRYYYPERSSFIVKLMERGATFTTANTYSTAVINKQLEAHDLSVRYWIELMEEATPIAMEFPTTRPRVATSSGRSANKGPTQVLQSNSKLNGDLMSTLPEAKKEIIKITVTQADDTLDAVRTVIELGLPADKTVSMLELLLS